MHDTVGRRLDRELQVVVVADEKAIVIGVVFFAEQAAARLADHDPLLVVLVVVFDFAVGIGRSERPCQHRVFAAVRAVHAQRVTSGHEKQVFETDAAFALRPQRVFENAAAVVVPNFDGCRRR